MSDITPGQLASVLNGLWNVWDDGEAGAKRREVTSMVSKGDLVLVISVDHDTNYALVITRERLGYLNLRALVSPT